MARYISFNRMRATSAGILLGSAMPLSPVLITLKGIHEVQIFMIAIINGSRS